MPQLTPEQNRIVSHNEGNIIVSASAGSGKTFVMKERLIRLICEGKAKIDNVLAVTFTNSSALDMKLKIRKGLEETIENYEKIQSEYKKEGRTLISKEELSSMLLEVQTANISTIHSFCMRLIRQYFFIVGASPDFKLIDEAQAEYLKTKCINDTFRNLYNKDNKDNADFIKLLETNIKRRSDKSFRELVLSLYDYSEVEQDTEKFFSDMLNVYCKDNFDNLIKEYEKAIKEKIEPALNVFTEFMQACKEVGYNLGTEKCEQVVATVKSFLDSSLYEGKKIDFANLGKWNGIPDFLFENKEGFVKTYESVKKTVKSLAFLTDYDTDLEKFLKNKESIARLIKIVKIFKDTYIQEKNKENLLDFSDLEHYAFNILSDEKGKALSDIRDKFSYIFVDEYQDVNAVQEGIISAISKNNLFMVGDVKQSIYGFRGCRPEFFTGKQSTMQANGESVEKLNRNFRSTQKVIDYVNGIFDYAMTEESFGLSYKTESKLVASSIYDNSDIEGRAELHIYEGKNDEDENSEETGEGKESLTTKTPKGVYKIEEAVSDTEEKKSSQALMVAGIIQKEIKNKYYDIEEKKEKKVRYKDIAIISRSLNNKKMENLVKVLNEMDIPVSTSMNQNACDFAEVKVLINLLSLLECFEQDIPLATVMISPFGRFSLEDLAEIVNFASKNGIEYNSFYHAYNYYVKNADTALKNKLVAFNKLIEEKRFLSNFKSAYEILTDFISESGYMDFLYSDQFGREKVKRVKSFLNKAKSGEKYLTTSELSNLVKNSPKSFDFVSSSDDNAVKLMTIHASKGLEYPVVICCNADVKFNDSDDRKEVLLSRDFGFAVKDFDCENKTVSTNILREVIKERNNRTRIKEEMRLFYVALTRAKFSLHIVGAENGISDSVSRAKCFMDFIPSAMYVKPVSVLELGVSLLDGGENSTDKNRPKIVETDTIEEDKVINNLNYEYGYKVDTTLPVKSSVSKVLSDKNKAEKEEYYKTEIIFKESEDKTDTESGIIAHRIMQYYNFFSEDDFYSQIEKIKQEGVVTDKELESINKDRLKKVIDSGVFKAFSGQTVLREKPFISNIEGNKVLSNGTKENIIIQGVIDFLATDGKNACIIDYKYSKKGKEKIKESYSLQLEVYAEAVKNSTGLNVSDKKIINLYNGEIIDM